jgi:dihydropteroate synthase
VLGVPLLVGLSRKRMLGAITGRPERERLAAGLAAAVLAIEHGARIIRTHDVPETVDAARLCRAIMQSRKATGRRP